MRDSTPLDGGTASPAGSIGPVVLHAGLASAAAVGLQVLLPRWFSVLLWYHLGFLAVSLAMLGFAAGGLIVHRRLLARGPSGDGLCLPTLAAATGCAILLALLMVVRIPVRPDELLVSPTAALLLVLTGLILAVPFVLMGTIVCAGLQRGRHRIGFVYGATFLGGAAGAALCLAAMQEFGMLRAGALLGLLPLLGTLRRPRWSAAPALILVAAVLAAPSQMLPFTSRKHFPNVPPERVLAERSDAFAYCQFYENTEHHGLWTPPSQFTGPMPESVGIAIDAWAITFITRRSSPEDFPELLPYHSASLAFAGAPSGFHALVLGAGGGWDVLSALQAGAGHVTAVEINALIADAVRDEYGAYSGHLFDDPRVRLEVAEGRHFLENDTGRYDRIVMAGVDTFAATQAGAFALAENYLYTVEAFRSFLGHLKPGGVLSLTRWWFEPPRQTVRLALTAAQALSEEGAGDPARRLFIALGAGGSQSLILIKQGSDFSVAELQALQSACSQRGAVPIFAWNRPSHPVLVEALGASDPAAWAARYPFRVEPTTDDRPFFFEQGRFATLFRTPGDWIHDRVGGLEVVVCTWVLLALLSAPLLWLARPGAGKAAGGPSPAPGWLRARLAFAFLGMGYLLVELPLMQSLSLVLGHPVLAVAVVLVALLIGSGAGSVLAGKLRPGLVPLAALAAAAAVTGPLAAGQEALVGWVAPLGLAARIAGVGLWVGLPGVLLGTCFPLALRSLGRRDPHLVPSAFLWNGLASVLAGPTAVLLALAVGFRPTLLAGAACYVAAALALAMGGDGIDGRRPSVTTIDPMGDQSSKGSLA